ncbi:MAG: hypothetical protein WCF85_04425 [Rhodospirillaceae bacterium]
MKIIATVGAVLVAVFLSGCQTDSREQVLNTNASQVQLRSFQSRAFDTTDQQKTLRTVIATLQDLGFVIDKADATLGTVSGTKLDGYQLRMSVSVRPKGDKQLMVRGNAQFALKAVEEPGPYQQFFAALEKGMFLTAHEVD